MMKVAPSLLSADFAELKKDVKKAEAAGADLLHLDVMDGHFVPNISFGAGVIKAIRGHTSLPFDTHLMISHPLSYIKDFADAGSDYITFHIECDDDADEIINAIHSLGLKAGVSIKPGTSVECIENLLDKVDLVLVMSVEPGFGGQKFIQSAAEKVEKLINIRGNRKYIISVDGGVNAETARLIDGADIVVAGSSVFGKEDLGEAIKAIKGL